MVDLLRIIELTNPFFITNLNFYEKNKITKKNVQKYICIYLFWNLNISSTLLYFLYIILTIDMVFNTIKQ